jgi:glycosyltransferase involved in cell wall biosynthesis
MPAPDDNRPSLLLVTQDQFGYLTDTLKYCRYLQKDFRITYIGWDFGLPVIDTGGIACIHLSRAGGKLRRYAVFLREVLQIVRRQPADGVIFIEYFPLCALLALFSGHRKRMVMDIRTGYVRSGGIVRAVFNGLLTVEAMCFRNVTVISDSLRRFLSIPAGRAHVVPLGADAVQVPDKEFAKLRLFYVGSLENRQIDKTVRGLELYMSRHPGAPIEGYDIVGFGPSDEEGKLRTAMQEATHVPNIVFHGRIPSTQLGPFLSACNTGVAFIPGDKHYQVQPATKIFEYLLAGMVVIATQTYENTRVINDSNGVLTDDSAEGFAAGLEKLMKKRMSFMSPAIRDGIGEYAWHRIVAENLLPYLTGLLRQS